jgi:hypothetical protein
MRFLLATALLVLVSSSAAAGAAAPRLTLLQASPVVVGGTGFTPGEKVSVGYTSGRTHLRRAATATARGTVRVVFGGVTFVRCRGAAIRAQETAEVVILPCSVPNGRPRLSGTLTGLLRGVGFVPGEHVRLTGRVSDGDPVSATIDAGTSGAFVVRLPVQHAPCAELFYRAVGSLGSTATFSAAAPACKAP